MAEPAQTFIHFVIIALVGIVVTALALVFLPFILLFILVYAFIAPARLRSTIFRFAPKHHAKDAERTTEQDTGKTVDVDCTVLDSKEVKQDDPQ